VEVLTLRKRVLAAAALLASAAIGSATLATAAPAKVLRVATSGDYAPFSYSSKSSGGTDADLDGFDLAVARQFARERGYRIEIVRFQWPNLGLELAAGSFDVAMSGVTVRVERSISGRFSVPVAATHAVALSWRGSGSATRQELDAPSHRVAVNAGGHLEQVARDVFHGAKVTALPDNDAVRMALFDRSFDAVLSDNFEQRAWTAGSRDIVAIGPLSDDRKAYLLPADRAALAAELDLFLIERERDGTLSKLRARYFGEGAETMATAEPVTALAAAAVERLALMPLVYDAKRRLGKPVEDKTQEVAVLDAALRTLDEAAAASGATRIDPDASKRLFEALIGMGRDEQQRLFERDGGQRPGVVLHSRPDGSTLAEVTATPPQPEASPRAAAPAHGYDLASELRPAISRITEKIARIVLTIDRPLDSVEVRRILDAALAARGVRSERIEALSDSIVGLSAARSASPH